MRRVTMLAAVLVLAMAGAAAAQPPGGGMRHPMPGAQGGRGQGGMMGPEQHMADVMAKLNLTDDQKQQVHKLMMDNQAKNKDLMGQMQKLHEQLRDQVFADSGPADTSATVRQIEELHNQMLESQVELHAQVARVLNATQRKQMREMPMPGMMGMMGMPMERGRGGQIKK